MLVKEYRIPLPLTVDEYRIAQLYMIAKKSRNETHGEGSGVEIVANEPYSDGPGGSGQYTQKIYHIGSHLPGWFKSLLPKSALTVEEEAWNAYPYTRTRYTCPFVEKFSLDIETVYHNDAGHQDNVFKLSASDLAARQVDLIDVVRDQESGCVCTEQEDPRRFVSEKTGRGPLSDDWIQQYWSMCQGQQTPLKNGMAVMCAYKLCKVEFRYWGMQTKIERFIHDIALRRTMLHAHCQAWAWQDEWHGLSIADIRRIEADTQKQLAAKFNDLASTGAAAAAGPGLPACSDTTTASHHSLHADTASHDDEDDGDDDESEHDEGSSEDVCSLDTRRVERSLKQPGEVQARQDSVGISCDDYDDDDEQDDSRGDEDDEFFDCYDGDLLRGVNLDRLDRVGAVHQTRKSVSTRHKHTMSQAGACGEVNDPVSMTSGAAVTDTCKYHSLLLVLHAGSVLDTQHDTATSQADFNTLCCTFDSVLSQYYEQAAGRVHFKLVHLPAICQPSLQLLTQLSAVCADGVVLPETGREQRDDRVLHALPLGAVPLLAVSPASQHSAAVKTAAGAVNDAHRAFLQSPQGAGFSGQVVLIVDAVASLFVYDMLTWCSGGGTGTEAGTRPSSAQSNVSLNTGLATGSSSTCTHPVETDHTTAGLPESPRTRNTRSSGGSLLDFEVSHVFLFGTPLGLVLAHRQLNHFYPDKLLPRPRCHAIYNLFHPINPLASRLEPLVCASFAQMAPLNVPRHHKFPLGNGQPTHLFEYIYNNPLFCDDIGASVAGAAAFAALMRRGSMTSESASGAPYTAGLAVVDSLLRSWWGERRLDYAVYSPGGLVNFPPHCLPHLFHTSFWESRDVAAFIARNILSVMAGGGAGEDAGHTAPLCFAPPQPCEKWQHKRTSVKIKNISSNHRGQDLLVLENQSQTVSAKFAYGPLDMISLSGERVDLYLMQCGSAGWQYLDTAITDRHGKLNYTVPVSNHLPLGTHPVKMHVRGDHSSCEIEVCVLANNTECVVFSIDGSFTASVSVSGRDPRVRASAVHVVRHWQQLGFLIIYITGRPDIQKRRVLAWLSQHKFPRGVLSFADGLSTEPLKHKADHLKQLVQDCGIIIHAAYGSAKDISVYSGLGLAPEQTFIVGKPCKKHNASYISDGYAAHLATLQSVGGSRPARGNSSLFLTRDCFESDLTSGVATRYDRRAISFTTASTTSSSTSATQQQQQQQQLQHTGSGSRHGMLLKRANSLLRGRNFSTN